jgi:hypothetical protein
LLALSQPIGHFIGSAAKCVQDRNAHGSASLL